MAPAERRWHREVPREFPLSETAVVILAAGQGTRMKSNRAKVLHEICGVPMLGHVIRNAQALSPSRLLVVVGRDADEVERRFEGQADFVLQAEQNGTGHAVQVAMPALSNLTGDILVLYGDTPLLQAETIEQMSAVKRDSGADMVILTARAKNIPGIIVRGDDGAVSRVVEKQDATPEELAIEERNTGVYLFDAALLRDGLAQLRPNNEQGELYLTDVVGYAVEKGLRVEGLEIAEADECLGINTRIELSDATRVMRRRLALQHMAEGVTFIDPEAVYLDADVKIGRDTILHPGVVVTGDSSIGEGCVIKPGCMIEDSVLDEKVEIGPSAHLRPGSHLGAGVKIGNFVEIKNSTLGPGTKAAHLGYIGDADVGARVNFSCGAIVVNYDGYQKTRSTIGDDAFIGCNANLVSPVVVEPKGFVAAGSTITRDVPGDSLAVARERQRNIEGWVARKEGRSPARPAKAAAAKPKPKKKKTKKKATRKKASKSSSKKTAKKSAKKKTAKKKAVKKKASKRPRR